MRQLPSLTCEFRGVGPVAGAALLVDVAFLLALAQSSAARDGFIRGWLRLGGARYACIDALRLRLTAGSLSRWRNGETLASPVSERRYFANGACTICSLAQLAPEDAAQFAPENPA